MRIVQLLMIVLATALAACTRPTTVESAWTEGVSRNQTFGKVLIVGVTPNYTTRCRFERMMMDSLNTNGVSALTSCSRMKSSDPLTRDAVIAAVGETGADAVFATRLVDAKINVKEGGTDEARGEAYYKPVGYGYDSYYGGYGMPVTYVNFVAEAPTLTVSRTVAIASNLYETKNAALVYALSTTTYNKKSQGDVIDAVTTAIAKQMRKDGLVK